MGKNNAPFQIPPSPRLEPFKMADDGPVDMNKFGEHLGITCDGCECRPINGFRYNCTVCENHDFCENCYTTFAESNVVIHNNAENINMSLKAEDHAFEIYADPGFRSALSTEAPAQKVSKRVKPNEKCPCE